MCVSPAVFAAGRYASGEAVLDAAAGGDDGVAVGCVAAAVLAAHAGAAVAKLAGVETTVAGAAVGAAGSANVEVWAAPAFAALYAAFADLAGIVKKILPHPPSASQSQRAS